MLLFRRYNTFHLLFPLCHFQIFLITATPNESEVTFQFERKAQIKNINCSFIISTLSNELNICCIYLLAPDALPPAAPLLDAAPVTEFSDYNHFTSGSIRYTSANNLMQILDLVLFGQLFTRPFSL